MSVAARHATHKRVETTLCDDLSAAEWDAALAALDGHPLQSSLWGAARGVPDQHFALCEGGVPVWMARVEERRVPLLGRIAWVPKGPTAADPARALGPPPEAFLAQLRAKGFRLLIVNPNVVSSDSAPSAGRPIGSDVRTIWIDLTEGAEAAFARLETKRRREVRHAAKEGVVVAETRNPADIDAFVALCLAISKAKNFVLELNVLMIARLLQGSGFNAGARLFLAKHKGRVLAGALVLIVGRRWHYFWGGSVRGAGRLRAGEAVQWAVIEAAIAAGGTCYDLEGIDDASNPGTATFKRKLGGEEVTLLGRFAHPLSLGGHAIALGLMLRERR